MSSNNNKISGTKRKQYPSDRHLKGDDRHKEKKNRHKHSDDGHPCICGYSSCSKLTRDFYGTKHIYDRPPIRFKIPEHDLWGDFFTSLIRNLHVPDETVAKLLEKGKGFRFSVAAHHFTEDVVQQYLSNPHMKGVWKVRFGRAVARTILHLPLDKRDTDSKGMYFINANNPIVDAAKLVATIKSGRADRASGRSPKDEEKEAIRVSLAWKNTVLSKKDKELRESRDLIAALKNENRTIKQKAKRRGDRAKISAETNKHLRDEMEDAYTIEDVADILRKVGGTTRFTILDEKWHEKYDGAAKCMWGFNDFKETLVIVKCLFPDVDVKERPSLRINKKRKASKDPAKLKLPPLTKLERCLLCKLFFRRDLNEEFIGLESVHLQDHTQCRLTQSS